MENLENQNNPQYMKEYLEHALKFEKFIYTWSNALEDAQYEADELQEISDGLTAEKKDTEIAISQVDEEISNKKAEIYEYVNRYKRRFPIHIIVFLTLSVILGVFVALIAYLCSLGSSGNYDYLYLLPITPTIFIGYALLIYFPFFCYVMTGKRKRVKEYTQKLNNNYYEQFAVDKKAELSAQVHGLNNSINNNNKKLYTANINVKDVQRALDEAIAMRDEIYSLDVLPKKYRSLNAVATLYEYLENGVCTKVQGDGGIYYTYEYHIKIGLVIARLDVIISKLDQIQENQALLYDSIMDCHQLLAKMAGELEAGRKLFDERSAASLKLQQQQVDALNWQNWHAYNAN